MSLADPLKSLKRHAPIVGFGAIQPLAPELKRALRVAGFGADLRPRNWGRTAKQRLIKWWDAGMAQQRYNATY
jgi:hypothetical protein